MNRYLLLPIRELITRKLMLLMGPRQVGKTTLAKQIASSFAYYNYDIKKDLRVFQEEEWDRSRKLVIFDELHKMRKWKLWLKGIVDDEAHRGQQFLVTGSARLDIAKKMGDSLAGRFFSMRMHPLDLKELKGSGSAEMNYRKLISVGGFPEPFFDGTERFYRLWQKSHGDLIIRQDLLSLEYVRDIDGIELLTELLANRVGSTISFNALSEDLGRDDKTIKKWIGILERMYVIFRVSPFSDNVTRGLKKAGKYYFYDLGRVEGDESRKLENLVALALKKELEYREDYDGLPGELSFIQNKEKREIDFLVRQRKRLPLMVEVKLSDGVPSPNFEYFSKAFRGEVKRWQLVKNLDREFTSKSGIQVKSALSCLENLKLD